MQDPEKDPTRRRHRRFPAGFGQTMGVIVAAAVILTIGLLIWNHLAEAG